MKKLKWFTLASDGMPVLIDTSNIAFVTSIEMDDEDRGKINFRRVVLKEVAIASDNKWVDVSETLEQIRRKC